MAGESVPNPYLYDQNVMSLVGYPNEGDVVEPGPDGKVEILSVAWAGDDRVEAVDVSADGDEVWHEAHFASPDAELNVWRLFRCVIDLSEGDYQLVSRATDEYGRRQSVRTSEPGTGKPALADDEYPRNREGYGNNAYFDYSDEFTV